MFSLHSIVTLAVVLLVLCPVLHAAEPKVAKYVRFQDGDAAVHGVVEGDKVIQIDGDLFGQWKRTEKTHALDRIKLLPPTRPTQVLALAGNYRSHLPGEEVPEKFKIPQIFFKTPACLVPHGAEVVIPKGTNEVHFEAELVVVIGKRAKDVPEGKALEYVFGVTCGNDISARDWQKNDVQWWRAKGSDTFGPCGPMIVTGLNYDDLRLRMRVNGKTLQDQRTKDLIHSVAKQVSFISACVTLEPGDLIYTGTPGKTSAIKAGDVMEVELEGVGILKNTVVGPK